MDLFYSLLKIASMIATGAFGALGLLTRYKDDQGKITKWGKTALGGIVISSSIPLGLYVLETSRAKVSSAKAKAQAEATAQQLQTILVNAQITADQQKKSLEETNKLKLSLGKTLEQQAINLETTKVVAKDMRTSITSQKAILAGNQKISNNLSNAVSTLDQTSKATTSVLEETINRIDSLDVYFIVQLDPLAFNDLAGKTVLSAASIKLLEDDKAGKIVLEGEVAKSIIKEFQRRYVTVRDIIFADWSAGSTIARPHESKGAFDFDFSDIVIAPQGETGMSGFYFGEFKEGTISCGVKYTIPANRYAGIRQYKDLNGAIWRVTLQTGIDALKLIGAELSAGDFLQSVSMTDDEIVLTGGRYTGKMVIPADQFQSSK